MATCRAILLAFLPATAVRLSGQTHGVQWEIAGLIALCAIQSLFIAALLVERSKRSKAWKELRERLEFETLLTALSADFARLPAGRVDEAIDRWLERLAAFLGASSADLRCSDGTENGNHNRLDAQQQSSLSIPIHINDSVWMLTFFAPLSSLVWSPDLLPRVRLAGEILAGALVRKAGAEALQESQERYRLATASGRIIVWDWDLETSKFYFDPLLKSLLGYTAAEIGDHFEDWLRLSHPEDNNFLARIEDHVFRGDLWFEEEHRLLQRDGGVRWFLASGSVIKSGSGVRIVGTDTDITERKLAAQELQILWARLVDSQDVERRRIARELHDGTAQNLLALSLDLNALKLKSPDPLRQQLLDCQILCEQSLQEIRTLSYVLHPPALDEGGLLAALRWYLDGFSRRSGIHVELIAQEAGRLPQAIEVDLFRIVQECLANIHRHSGSRRAQVRVDQANGHIVLNVQDWGVGMKLRHDRRSEFDSFGAGLSGMRQRLNYLGGSLKIKSNSQGTTITAIVPLTPQKHSLSSSLDVKAISNHA